jgi:3-oxoacyl-[acyl-carrier protein] reductase
MLLTNKTAVIYGAAGSLGTVVAKTFAAAGAYVIVTGRKRQPLEALVKDIATSGYRAAYHLVDAADHAAIDSQLELVVKETGSLDISFNLTGTDVVQDVPLVDMAVGDFVEPVSSMLHTRFLTATAAGRYMKKQSSGVILSLTATPGGIGYPYTGGFAAACTAIETFAQNLGSELGIPGVRVVNIRSGGSPDSKVFKDAITNQPEVMEPILRSMHNDTMLKRLPEMADIANLATFLASDLARMITGVTVDITAGTTAALNYRVKR